MDGLGEASFALDRAPSDSTREVAYHVTPTRNVDAILRQGLLLRWGHRARTCGEKGPAIWAFPNREALEYGCMNWMTEMFSERLKLAILQIDVTGVFFSQNGYEIVIYQDLPAVRLRVVSRDTESAEVQAFFTRRSHDLTRLVEYVGA